MILFPLGPYTPYLRLHVRFALCLTPRSKMDFSKIEVLTSECRSPHRSSRQQPLIRGSIARLVPMAGQQPAALRDARLRSPLASFYVCDAFPVIKTSADRPKPRLPPSFVAPSRPQVSRQRFLCDHQRRGVVLQLGQLRHAPRNQWLPPVAQVCQPALVSRRLPRTLGGCKWTFCCAWRVSCYPLPNRSVRQ